MLEQRIQVLILQVSPKQHIQVLILQQVFSPY